MNITKQFEFDSKKLEEFNMQLNHNNYHNVLSDAYKYVKQVSPLYFKNGIPVNKYEYLKLYLMLIEEKVKNKKILDIPIDFDISIDKKNIIEDIIHITRMYLLKRHRYIGYRKGVLDIDFAGECKDASDYIKHICDDKKIKCYTLKISPGYDEKYMLFEGSGNHFFNVIEYNNNYYLIDVTYSQFFYAKRNNIDRLGIVDLSGCSVGTFMLMNENRKKIAESIIKYGYIKLDENIFKDYMDGFTLSFRNGLYYEEKNDYSYTTEYKIDDYVNFFKKKDSQVKHEGVENLGFQKKLLKNPNIIFRKEV